MFSVFFTDAPVTDFASAKATETWRYPAFFHALLDAGVYPPCSAFETWFVSAALDDDGVRPDRRRPARRRAGRRGGQTGMTRPNDDRARDAARRGAQPGQDPVRPAARLPPVGQGPGAGRSGSPTGWRPATSSTSWPRRWSARRRPPTPIAERHGLPIDTDDELIESANIFQGQRVSPGDGALRDPRNWWHLRNPRTPSWGEPYAEIAERMTAALQRARIKAAGHEAVCVSHQLPVETLRRAMTEKPLHHFPTRRLCNLASLTSFYFHGDSYVGWGYSELAGQ